MAGRVRPATTSRKYANASPRPWTECWSFWPGCRRRTEIIEISSFQTPTRSSSSRSSRRGTLRRGEWTVVLVPQVLRELDSLKMRPGVGEKAAGVIRRIKEYARRGDTFSGVPLAPRLRLREVAVDADMTTTLSWLRAQHGDDELLASVLELRWTDLSSVVAIATRDRNLQNKARMARVPYLDVEDDI